METLEQRKPKARVRPWMAALMLALPLPTLALLHTTKAGATTTPGQTFVRRFEGGVGPWPHQVYFLDSSNNLWLKNPQTGEAKWIDGNVKDFQAAWDASTCGNVTAGCGDPWKNPDGNVVYVLGMDGKLWREAPDMNHRGTEPIDSNVAKFQYDPNNPNNLLVLGQDGNLWYEKGTWRNRGYAPIGSGIKEFKAVYSWNGLYDVPTGRLYSLKASNNELWAGDYQQSGNAFQTLIEYSVKAFSPYHGDLGRAETAVLVLTNDGNLWWEGAAPGKTLIDRTVAAMQALDQPPGTNNGRKLAYVLGTNGNLWREPFDFTRSPAGTNGRDKVDGYVVDFQGIYYDNVLVQGSDGNLWNEHKDWQHRDPNPITQL